MFTSPDRPNIFYVVRPRTDIDYDMKPFVCSLKNHCILSVIKLCADLFGHFMAELSDDVYTTLLVLIKYLPIGQLHVRAKEFISG